MAANNRWRGAGVTLVVARRGRCKTVCARGVRLAAVCGRSASPLNVSKESKAVGSAVH